MALLVFFAAAAETGVVATQLWSLTPIGFHDAIAVMGVLMSVPMVMIAIGTVHVFSR